MQESLGLTVMRVTARATHTLGKLPKPRTSFSMEVKMHLSVEVTFPLVMFPACWLGWIRCLEELTANINQNQSYSSFSMQYVKSITHDSEFKRSWSAFSLQWGKRGLSDEHQHLRQPAREAEKDYSLKHLQQTRIYSLTIFTQPGESKN